MENNRLPLMPDVASLGDGVSPVQAQLVLVKIGRVLAVIGRHPTWCACKTYDTRVITQPIQYTMVHNISPTGLVVNLPGHLSIIHQGACPPWSSG